MIRYCKTSLVAASAFFLWIVVFNNITDYGSNFAFVENVLNMSTTFEGNKGMWRAIDSPAIHHIFYISIILWEALAAAILSIATLKMFKASKAPYEVFKKAKELAIMGFTINLLQWFVAFLTVGAEWFLMWQSQEWNGQNAAGRMFMVIGVCLLFVLSKEGDED